MVTVTSPGDSADFSSLIESLSPNYTPQEIESVRLAMEHAARQNMRLPGGEPMLEHVIQSASILAGMHLDCEAVEACLLLFCGEIGEAFGEGVGSLIEGVKRFSSFDLDETEKGELEGLRKMLLAIVQDIRVVLIKLADQLQSLRYLAGSGDAEARLKAAVKTRDIYAPLANRLGIWQIKWEMEDLSFRILEPETYKKIARLLDEKRVDRERFIETAITELRGELESAGIRGEISGRPKHIYSIYKKMQRKNLGFESIYDVRAIRVLVDDVKDCYGVLGIAHDLWIPIPGEFDDYIAKPKENGYSSLHTGVIGPEGKALEVQIRTREMHHASEMGVAAHWRYKEGGRRDFRFEEKLLWLRKLMGWRDELGESANLAQEIREGLYQEAVYVMTPQGKVIDLPRDATPLDFAYHVHTDLGHRCRGAKVDGAIVPLNTPLKTGQRVEIIAAKQGGPSLDWLNPEQGFAKSSRARAKIRQWFNSRNFEASVAQGRLQLERELKRAGKSGFSLEKVADHFSFAKLDDFLVEVGRGNITRRQIQSFLREETAEPQTLPVAKIRPTQRSGEVLIVGVDKLLTLLAKCCKPVPPDEIIGFVTRGRGVMIHRKSCTNVAHLDPDRLLEAQWGPMGGKFPADIVIEASDRQGLLRDISDILARERINVTATRTSSRVDRASMRFTIAVSDLAELRKVLGMIMEVSGVVQASRR
ncbi:MAG: RelA/SpoT family protein [Burkholderiales bacterium]